MSGRSVRTVGSIVAGITAVIYVALVCLAATCSLALPVSASAGGHEQHHSHDSHETAHSSLCAWACQATPESGLVASAPADVVESVVLVPVVSPVQLVSVSSVSLLRSRAPPVLPLG